MAYFQGVFQNYSPNPYQQGGQAPQPGMGMMAPGQDPTFLPMTYAQNPQLNIAPPTSYGGMAQWAQDYYGSRMPGGLDSADQGRYQRDAFDQYNQLINTYGRGDQSWVPYAYRQGSGQGNSGVFGQATGGLGFDPKSYDFLQASRDLAYGNYGSQYGVAPGLGNSYVDPTTGQNLTNNSLMNNPNWMANASFTVY